MGGPGSSRWNKHRPRLTIGDVVCLDIDELVRAGHLYRNDPFHLSLGAGDHEVEIICNVDYEIEAQHPLLEINFVLGNRPHCQPIKLRSVPRYFGSNRHYFICPHHDEAGHQQTATTKLYQVPGEFEFSCRQCQRLSYPRSRPANDKIQYVAHTPATVPVQMEDLPSEDNPDKRKQLALQIRDAEDRLEEMRGRLGSLNQAAIRSRGPDLEDLLGWSKNAGSSGWPE